jgi:hypothetical protein
MGLAPGEQRTLAEIESVLCRSDPAFAAMFSLLAEADRRKRPAGGRLRRHPLGPVDGARLIAVLAVGVAFLVTCIVMAVAAAAHGTPSQDGHGRDVSPASIYAPRTP